MSRKSPRHRRRRDRHPPRIRIERDAETVFRTAIAAGVLSGHPSATNWAGHYDYMFHDENGRAWFRRRDGRVCVSMSSRRARQTGLVP